MGFFVSVPGNGQWPGADAISVDKKIHSRMKALVVIKSRPRWMAQEPLSFVSHFAHAWVAGIDEQLLRNVEQL
jgi:predicted patatin/cPLA2 family phospholipase